MVTFSMLIFYNFEPWKNYSIKIKLFMKRSNYLTLFMVIVISMACSSSKNHNEAYEWKNVTITGGGFVDGIVFHPTEKDLRYARTDMGGAYRWDEQAKRWIPLTDWVSYAESNLMGIESIALDPNDPDKLYMACGTYTRERSPNGEILVSNDRGNTFTRLKVPFKFGGNENGRGNGERMRVDPLNGNIIYLGTRHAGLWKSTDAGMSWNKVESFPDVTETAPDSLSEREQRRWMWNQRGSGIVWIAYAPQKTTADKSQHIFAGVSLMNRHNLFQSTDGGKTWEAVAGQPTQYRPTQGKISSNGNLYIAYGNTPGPSRMTNGGVWKYNIETEKWTDITPDKPNPETGKTFGYATVEVAPSNPETILASVFHRWGEHGGADIYRSTNGGETWKPIMESGAEFDYSIAPYTEYTPLHWMFDVEINPFNPNHAIFTTGFGGFETFNLSDIDNNKPVKWSVYTRGIEETVPLSLCSPPEGAHLITGIGDYAGFVHWNLDKAEEGQYFKNPFFGNCDDVTCAWQKPEVIVRVGISSGHHNSSNIGYSVDYGKSWKPATMPTDDSRHGSIAVSADGATWVWTPQRQKPYRTSNKGETWAEITELTANTRVVADKVNPLKFYAVDLYEGVLYQSTDGAKSFTTSKISLENGLAQQGSNRGDRRGGQDRIYATPGYENDLWIAAFNGLYHAPIGKVFSLQPKVSEIHGFGFGKAAPGEDYPALYLIGTVNGTRGIYRSDDKAQSWVRINDDEHEWGLLLHITGDPKKYGRVYIGTHGRGAIYGDPLN